jgi:hypothetical protein
MKKSCNNCKAYEFHQECSLGYKNERGEPKEDCPKPLTTKALVLAMKQIMIFNTHPPIQIKIDNGKK